MDLLLKYPLYGELLKILGYVTSNIYSTQAQKIWKEKSLVFSLFHLMISKYPCYAKSIYLHNLIFPRLVSIKNI